MLRRRESEEGNEMEETIGGGLSIFCSPSLFFIQSFDGCGGSPAVVSYSLRGKWDYCDAVRMWNGNGRCCMNSLYMYSLVIMHYYVMCTDHLSHPLYMRISPSLLNNQSEVPIASTPLCTDNTYIVYIVHTL